MEYYRINIKGLERDLKICPINDKLSIAAFIMLGDVELTVHTAAELLKICNDFDFIVSAEAKGIPLAHEMSRQSGKPYFICRKGAKLYMADPVSVDVRSITTARQQTLFLDSPEGEQMRGKRVLIADDVISTGESLSAIEALLNKFDVQIVDRVAVLAEGDAVKRDDIKYLQELPLFFK